jgi:hypothetical protein
MENANDLREYLHDILDSSVQENETFICELLQRWRDLHSDSADSAVSPQVEFYKNIVCKCFFMYFDLCITDL